jgi:HK97 family phage major capsid protein
MSEKDKIYERISDIVAEQSKPLAEAIQESKAKSEEQSEKLSTVERTIQDLQAERKAVDPYGDMDHGEAGLDFARFVQCHATAARNRGMGAGGSHNAIEISAEKYGADNVITKALQASNATAGGLTIPGTLSSDFIELLRASSRVEAAGPRRVPLDSGTITLPKLTAGATGSWIGEGTNITHSQQTVGNVTLTAKKYATLTSISNDLLDYSSVDIDRMVRDDLVRDATLAVDLAFIRGTGVAAQPKGMSQMEGITTFAATTASLAAAVANLGRAIQELMDDNVAMSNVQWGFAPRIWRYLFTVLDGNGNAPFRDEMAMGKIFGFPFWTTTQIPVNLGAGTDSEIYLVDYDDIVVGTASEVQVSASSEAAYHDGSAVVAAFSRDEVVVRVIVRKDINTRHAESIVHITGVDWAA